MNYTMPSNVALHIDAIQRHINLDVELVGGALRDAVLGGEVSDYDLVFVGDREQMYNYMYTLTTLGFEPCHHSEYASDEPYVFDMRKGVINIIMYDENIVSDIDELVSKFDMNINQYRLIDGQLINNYFDGKTVKINPYRDALGHSNRLQDRVAKFKAKYPNLDWSVIDGMKRDPIYGTYMDE